jgi:ATP-dependent helicase/DNAse subunit B
MNDRPVVDLILAPAACGKTQAAVDLLREPRAGRALALVPSREQQRALYGRMGGRRVARAVQFYQLAGIILERAGGAPQLLGDTARLGLVRAILGAQRDEGRLPAYAAVAHKRGFVAAVVELLTDLGDADIVPEAFAAAAATPRDVELADVYARYVAFQERRGVADLPRRLALARDVLTTDHGRPTTDDRPPTADNGRPATDHHLTTDNRLRITDYGLRTCGPLDGYELLVVDGFDQFTSLQLSLLAALAHHVPRMAITLTLDERERPAQRRFARTYENLRNAFSPHRPARSPTLGRAGEVDAQVELHVTRLNPDPGRCAAPLRHLEAHLFDLNEQPRNVLAEGAVTLIEAADREREVRAVLRRVKRLIDDGTSPGQIAVLFRDGAVYNALLREVAEEYGLLLDMAEGLPLDQAPPIATLLGLLRLPLDDYPRRALIETLRSPYLDHRPPTTDQEPRTENQEPKNAEQPAIDQPAMYGGSSVSALSAPDAERYSSGDDDPETTDNRRGTTDSIGSLLNTVARHKGIAGGLTRWRAALEALAAAPSAPHPPTPSATSGEDVSNLNRSLGSDLLPLSPAWERGTAGEGDEAPPSLTPADAAALLDALGRFCAWIAPPERATIAEHLAWVEERIAALRLDDGPFADRDRQAIDRFSKLLRDLARTATLLEAPPLPFRTFFDDLADAAASARYQLRVAGGVAAMPALAARGLGFDHIAILGLSEGEFPRPLAEPAIYRRAERRTLRLARSLPLPAPDPADERTIFYEAVARARRGLILARTRLDESGNPLPRSPYLTALLDLIDGVDLVNVPAGGAPAWDEAASPQEQALALAEIANCKLQIADYQAQAPQSAIYNLQSAMREEYPAWDHVVRARAVEAGREGLGAYGPFEGAIDDTAVGAEVASRFGPDHRWSVTEFNDYITCPFRFAAAHVLHIEPRREAEEALDGGRRGQLYHAILARAGEQWRAARLVFRPDDEDAALATLDLAAQEVLDAAPERMGFAPSPIWPWERDELRRRLRAALRGFIRGDKGDWQAFEPAAVEQTFGGRRGAPPLRVETPDGPALVHGRIDRVDQRADGALAVVDYKSSSASRPAKDALEGRDLQLAVYVLAVEQVLAAGRQVERAAFFQIGSGRRGAELKGQQLRDAIQAAQERIAETIAAVRAADFRVRPRDKCPEFCEFEAICRRNLEKRRHQEDFRV